MNTTETLVKYKVFATLRDAEEQIKEMKQIVFSKDDVIEILEDLIHEFKRGEYR